MSELEDEYEVTVLLKNKRTGTTSWIKYLRVHNLDIDNKPYVEEGEEIRLGYGVWALTASRVRHTDVTLDFRAQGYMYATDIEKTPLDSEHTKKWEADEWQ